MTEKPLFMSVGFYRPHRPLQVPKPWFEQFPVETIRRPAEPEGKDDWDDRGLRKKLARSHAHKALHRGLSDHEFIVKNEQWDETIQAYHASIAFVDKQIGRFLESLKKNPRGATHTSCSSVIMVGTLVRKSIGAKEQFGNRRHIFHLL